MVGWGTAREWVRTRQDGVMSSTIWLFGFVLAIIYRVRCNITILDSVPCKCSRTRPLAIVYCETNAISLTNKEP